MKLLIVACVIAAACARPSEERLGTEKCTYGPSYWCENYRQAVQCKAIEHCREHVWIVKQGNCDECKAAVKEFNDLLTHNESKVMEIMGNLCSELGAYSSKCKSLLKQYGSTIIVFLKQFTSDGEKLCQDLELCAGKKFHVMKKAFLQAIGSLKDEYCDDCKMVFTTLKEMLQDKDIDKEIVSLVEMLCTELGSFADQCKTYVDQYLPLVLQELASLDDPTELCTELGLCNQTKEAIKIVAPLNVPAQKKKIFFPIMPGPVMITPPEKTNTKENELNDNCDECKAAVKLLNGYVTNNASKVLEIMNNICGQLGSMAAECKFAVGVYGKKIISALKELTSDGEKLCQELEMCPSSDKTRIMKTILLKHIKTSPHIRELHSAKEDFCEDCKLVFAEIKDVLQDKDMQKEISNLLESLCAELGSFAAECKSLIDQYLPMILDELASLDDPAEICKELGLCNTTVNTARIVAATKILRPGKENLFFPVIPAAILTTPAENSKSEKEEQQAPENSVECLICEFAMSKLDSILGDNATKEEIEAALDKLCSLLPSTVSSECEAFVQTYGPEIIKLLLSELKPSQVCTALGLCSGQGEKAKVSLKMKAMPNDETCDLCKMAVQYLENILKSNATEEEIKKALEEICNLLPSSLKTECNAIVKEYGDLIIKLILGQITPEEVCEALNLCQASSKLPITDECVLGESYWCASYENAKKCKALKHCNFLA